MIDFSIDRLVKTGSLFEPEIKFNKNFIDSLEEYSQNKFHENPTVYQFYFENYNIEIIYYKKYPVIVSQQVIIQQTAYPFTEELATNSFGQIATLDQFLETYKEEYDEKYYDEDEVVIFMKSGVDAYFNKQNGIFYLTIISSPSSANRKLVKANLQKMKY